MDERSLVSNQEVWIDIQLKTFTNWVNEQLKDVELTVSNLQTDFSDGIKLIALVEALQKRRLKKIRRPINQHQSLENVQTALNALAIENIKLVNIGCSDIVNGNLKLILGLVWLLILHYQIGKSNIPPKKLMMIWIQSVIPQLNISNFTSDWNNGIALSALINYCKPGTCPNWRNMNPRESLFNCQNALFFAQKELNVPMIIKAEDLCNQQLDERSTMTYLSYFFKENGPGYRATLSWVQSILPHLKIKNFTTDWNDGHALCSLVTKLGGYVPGYPYLSKEKGQWEHNLQLAMNAAKSLGIETFLKPKHLATSDADYFGIMAYIARFQNLKISDKFAIIFNKNNTLNVNSEVRFILNIPSTHRYRLESIRVEVNSPNNKLVTCEVTINKNGGKGWFKPLEPGLHVVRVFHENTVLHYTEINIGDINKPQLTFNSIDPCSLGSLVQVLINSNGVNDGKVGVAAKSPSGQLIECSVDENNGSYGATFTPNEIGKWLILVTYDGEHISGSPFLCDVFDINKVRLRSSDQIFAKIESQFLVDISEAGPGTVSAILETLNGEKLPVDVINNENIVKICILCLTPGRYRLKVYFNDILVRGTPMLINVNQANFGPTPSPRFIQESRNDIRIERMESKEVNGIMSNEISSKKWTKDITNFNNNKITVKGSGLKYVPVKTPVTFILEGPSLQQHDFHVSVIAPSGLEIPIRIDSLQSGSYEIEYITPEVGEHLIDIFAYGKPIDGSPFKSSVYDATKIKVGSIPNGFVGKSIQFEIDGSEAGSGNLEILVNGGRVTSEVKSLGNHRFLASFVPHTATLHLVEMKFNDEPVQGSPWKVNVAPEQGKSNNKTDRGIIKVDSMENLPVGQTHSFDISAHGYKKEDLRIDITGPSMIPVQYRIVDLQNDTFRIYFSVSVVGTYLFEIIVLSDPSQNYTFSRKAYDISRIHVSDVPKRCLLSEKCEFQVDASQAGEGQLEIAVNDGEVPNQVQVLGNGKCTVSFKPESCIPHMVDIKFNRQNVAGCPFVVEVSDTSQFNVNLSDVELISVGKKARFIISSENVLHSDSIKVVINSPTGKQLPVFLSYTNVCTVEFTPTEVGTHIMTIEHCSRLINVSPFIIKTYDPSKVIVTSVTYACMGKPVEFIVDASNSGEGNLEISVTSKGKNIQTQVQPMGGAKFRVAFVPADIWDHIVAISFNNEPVPESPFVVNITADLDKVSVSGAALHFAPVNTTSTLIIHNATNEKDLLVRIEGPNGIIPSKIIREQENFFVNFHPTITGEYQISISYKNISLSGSPFSTKIYDLRQIKVKEMPKEILINKPVSFLVEATNAGPGNLEVIVNNGKVPSTPQALGPSLYAITFIPKEVKDHHIDVKFNGELVPDAPFVCCVLDTSKFMLHKEGLDRVPVNSLASFFVETHGGDLCPESISILGPLHKHLEFDLSGDPQSGYKISFEPHEVGDHLIDLKVCNESIADCPFLMKVYDAKRVKVSEPTKGAIGKPVFFSIDASQAGAGNLEIIVSVNGRNVPNYVQSEGNAKFKVNFKPSEPSIHMVSVKFNSESVPGSPYMVKVIDSSQSLIASSSVRMASLSKGVEFQIENKNDLIQECNIQVTSPSNKKIPSNIRKAEGCFNVNFSPIEVGPHQIDVQLDGVTLNGCPFSCNVYDVSKIKVGGLGQGYVGKPITFQVDASLAGEGTLELVVTTRKSSLRAEVLMRTRGLYDVTFIPQEKISHYINITFNEEDVPGSPFKIEIKDPLTKNFSMIKSKSNGGLVGITNYVMINTNDENINVKVIGPQRNQIPCKVNRENDQIRVEYIPKEIGSYNIETYLGNVLQQDKITSIEVCDPSKVKLVDLQHGVIGREQTFKVDCSRAGRGNLALSVIAGDNEIQYSIKEISPIVFLISFIPKHDLPHYINVLYNDTNVPASPYLMEIRDPSQSIIVHGTALKYCIPGQASTFLIENGGFASSKNFDVIITDPLGSPLNVKCYQQVDGSLLAEFVPFRTGPHEINVLYLEKSVSGSPFISEAFDASKVSLQKIKSTNFVVNEKIIFALNRKEAGYAELDVTVTSPLGRHLPIEVKGTPDGEGEMIEFIPTVPGKYKIAITFGGIEIPGSPITFIAQEGILPNVEGMGLKLGVVNEVCSFKINAKGIKGKPEVRVDGPDSEPDCLIDEVDGVYCINFVPMEVGVFDVRLLWNGRDLPGSPFHPKILNLVNVRPIGDWKSILNSQDQISLNVNEEKRISFDVTEAGPGKLNGFIKLPDERTQPLCFEQTGPYKFRLSFVPKLEGEYQLFINFSELKLPKSPLIAITSPTKNNDDCATVVLRGHGLAGARVGEETEFIIDGTEAGSGEPEITLTGVKADIAIRVTQISDRIFKATYTPTVQGTYLLNVLWDSKQVKGCPLKVSILPRCDASRVVFSGDGLKGGAIGKEIKAFIDTRRAGPGDLSAHCVGPNKIAFCELLDQLDGTFSLFIKPQEPGKHMLTIKYGGENISGSPFTIRIAGAPDASKVRVYGPGIEHGVLPLYQSRFVCDTRGAGAGQLTVRIRGPKGAFRVEMQRDNQKDRTILCKYDPTEPGDYRIEVKWAGEHVPGSPFSVMIFDTQDELNRYTQNQFAFGKSGHGPSLSSDYFGNNMAYTIGFGKLSWRGSTNEL